MQASSLQALLLRISSDETSLSRNLLEHLKCLLKSPSSHTLGMPEHNQLLCSRRIDLVEKFFDRLSTTFKSFRLSLLPSFPSSVSSQLTIAKSSRSPCPAPLVSSATPSVRGMRMAHDSYVSVSGRTSSTTAMYSED